MSKAKVVYQIMLYFLTVAIFVCGAYLYGALKQPKIDDEQANSSIVTTNPETDEFGFFVGGPCDVWDGTSEAPTLRDTTQNNSESNPYIIDTAEKLKWISEQSNNSSTRANIDGKYFLQTVNIDLNNTSWTPICNYSNAVANTEIKYNGGNHIIYNLNVSVSGEGHQYPSLFGRICNNSYVKNLSIENAVLSGTCTTAGLAHAGAFVGSAHADNGTEGKQVVLENLHTKNISMTANSYNGQQFFGGIVGFTNKVKIDNCSMDGTYTWNTTNITKTSSAGGIVGQNDKATYITNCSNSSNIIRTDLTTDCTGNVYTAGISAYNGNAIVGTVANCVNYGDLQVATISGNVFIAGIAAYSANFENCINYGYLFGNGTGAKTMVGGITAKTAYSSFNRCANYGDCYAICTGTWAEAGGIIADTDNNVTVTNCFNAGNVLAEGGTSALYSGGIVGAFDNATNSISNCYSVGSIGYKNHLGAIYLAGVCVTGSTEITMTNCYYNKDTAASGNWTDRGITDITYMSTTNNIPYGNSKVPITTNVTGLTTNQMQSAEDGVAPTGMTGFTAENWIFQKYAYPKLNVGYRPESGLEAGATETELVYNAAAQTPQIKSSSYGNSEFSDAKPKSIWDGESVAIPLLQNNTLANSETNPYIIDSAAKLAYLSAHPDWGNNKYVKQTVNIDLNWHKWTPINIIHANSGTPNYKYYYEGGNSIIYNLYIEEDDAPSVGLFAYFLNGYIKNLLINGSKVIFRYSGQVTGRNINIGTLMGNPNGVTIENCHVKNGSVKATNNHLAHIGGMFGYCWNPTIKNCSSDCSVWGDNHWTEGIMRVGGIIGHIQKGTLENLVNYGSVFGYSRTSSFNDGIIIGGIAGWGQGISLTKCINYGSVAIDSISNCQMGGMAGNFGVYIDNNNSANNAGASMSYCQNFGDLRAKSTSTTRAIHMGGFVGWAGPKTSGNVTVTYNNLISGGALYAEQKTANSRVGGIIGGTSDIEISNCLVYSSLRGSKDTDYIGGFVGHASTAVTATNCYYNITTMGNNADLYDGPSYTNISRGCGNLSSVVGNGLTTGQMLVKTTGTSPVCMSLSGEWKYIEGEYPTFKQAVTAGAFKYSEVDQNILTSEPISYWDGKSVEMPNQGDGSSSNPFIIDSAAKLAYISVYYMGLTGKYFKQTIDIDLNNHLWTPIAPYEYPGNFNWKYDGNYHTIYNLYVDIDDPNGWSVCAGLFGKLGNNGYIKNLTINGGSVHATGTGNNRVTCGAIAGFMYSTGGVVENCHNINVSVFAEKGSNSSYTHMGGIVGYGVGAQILNCTNRSDIDIMKKEQVKTLSAGGIVGKLEGTSSLQAVLSGCVNYGNIYNTNESFVYQFVGGIAGYLSFVDVTNCVNYGSVTLVGKVFECSGGMFGNAANTLTLNSVKNYGTVYIADINSTANRQRFVGGIIGNISTSGATVTLTNIENIGDVYCIGYVLSGNQYSTMPGGIIGITYANTTANGIINRGSVIAYSETNNMGSPTNNVSTGSFAAIQNSSALVVNDFMNTGSVWSTYRYNYVSSSSIVTPQTVSGGAGGGHTDKTTNAAGILLGNVENSASVTFRRCYWDSQKVSSNLKCIIRGTFLSNTGWNFLAFGLDVYSPTAKVGEGSSSQTSCVGVTTANLSVSTAGSAPSGASDLSSTYFDFSTVGTYPKLKASLTLSNPAYEKKCKVQNITSSRSVWDGTTSEKPTGEGTKVNPYKISSAANLYWLALNPSLGHNKYFVQTVDIDLAMHEWTPINGDSTSQNYTYYYDGNYHTIYNLYMNKTYTVGDSYIVFKCGLFGFLSAGSVLKNLTINGGSITVTTQFSGEARGFNTIVGSILCQSSGSSSNRNILYNLHNIGVNITINQNGAKGAYTTIGGLVGVASYTDGSNLSNSANLHIESYAKEWTNHGCVIGQIENSSIITNCYNSGNIYMCAYAAAGFAGGIAGSVATLATLKNSVNVGQIHGIGTSEALAGGIAHSIGTGGQIVNCVNYGEVIAKSGNTGGTSSFGGGLVGWIYQTDISTYNAGGISYCINYGMVKNGYELSGKVTGGLVGYIKSYAVISNCYYNTDLVNKIGTNITTKIIGSSGSDAATNANIDSTTVKGLTTAQMTCSVDGTMPAALVGFDSNIWKCYNSFMPTIVAGNYGVTYKNNVHAGTATALVIFDERSGFVGTKEANFEIVQAINSWVRNPAIAGWTYTNWPSTPVGQALFGTVSFSYLDANDNPVTLTSSSNAGSYKLVAEVALSDDYTMLRVVIEFTISPLDFSELVQIDLSGTSFVYDGQSHTPTETVTKTT